jgi:hypothetical protein
VAERSCHRHWAQDLADRVSASQQGDGAGNPSRRPAARAILDHVGVGLEEEPDVRVPDSLAEYLRTHTGVQRAGRVGVPQIVERDARSPRGHGEAVESLPDRVRMWWAAVLEGEHVVAGVIVGAEELALAVLTLAPSAQRRDGGPVNRYRLVGVMGLAGLVPHAATDDHPAVMHSDLAGIEVDGRPLKTTNLAPSDPGRQFKQEERCEPVALHRHQEGLDLVRPPHHAPLPRTFGWFDVAGRVVGDVLPGDGINERPVDHRMLRTGLSLSERVNDQADSDAQHPAVLRAHERSPLTGCAFVVGWVT